MQKRLLIFMVIMISLICKSEIAISSSLNVSSCTISKKNNQGSTNSFPNNPTNSFEEEDEEEEDETLKKGKNQFQVESEFEIQDFQLTFFPPKKLSIVILSILYIESLNSPPYSPPDFCFNY
ncbi:MAG: hypothetical protein RJA76_398 [Bacteroidota bacterium]